MNGDRQGPREGATRDLDVLCPHPTAGWWSVGWHALFYVALAYGLVQVLLAGGPASFLGAVSLVTILFGAWYWLWVGRRQLTTPARRGLYFTVAAALWGMLLAFDPAYELVSFSAFVQLTGYLPSRPAVPAIVAVVALVEVYPAAHGEVLGTGDVVDGLITLAVAAMAIVPMRAIHIESERRRRLIDELEVTRRDLAVAEREAGTLQERERLAGAIHDTVAQGLSSIVMLLEAAQASLRPSAVGASSHIEQALQAARGNLREVRRLVWALRPEALESGTLAEAVTRSAASTLSDSGIDLHVYIEGDVRRLPTEVEVTLLRAAQELSSNIRRHSMASQATLCLAYHADAVTLTARDDGKGIPIDVAFRDPTEEGGLGLVMMRERIEALGGSLHVDDMRPGTSVSLRLPLSAHARETTRHEPHLPVR